MLSCPRFHDLISHSNILFSSWANHSLPYFNNIEHLTMTWHVSIFQSWTRLVQDSNPWDERSTHSAILSGSFPVAVVPPLPVSTLLTMPSKMVQTKPDEWDICLYLCCLCLLRTIVQSSCSPLAYCTEYWIQVPWLMEIIIFDWYTIKLDTRITLLLTITMSESSY